MNISLDEIRRRIAEVAPGLHAAGTFSARTLESIAEAAGTRQIRHSAETGSGASTLLLSHLSEHHTVFALEDGRGSVVNVRRSPLLRPGVVTFIEGPTQTTLPLHRFTEKLQLALIDGPHAYPFPDLEYYYLYPHLDTGALLIVDDIHIPTVHHLFEFLRRDAMFHLDRVIERTAFFTRTSAPAFDPFGDGWEQQNYNRTPLARYTWKQRLKAALPVRLPRAWSTRRARCSPKILAPASGAVVGSAGTVEGSVTLPADSYLWILIRRKDVDGWWPQGGGPALVERTAWKVAVAYGEACDAGFDFEIAAVVVAPPTHQLWTDWVARAKETGECPPVPLPPARSVLGEAFRTVRKA